MRYSLSKITCFAGNDITKKASEYVTGGIEIYPQFILRMLEPGTWNLTPGYLEPADLTHGHWNLTPGT